MSKLRPTVGTTNEPLTVSNDTAYLMILNAVQMQAGLIHGKLEANGQFCAVGSFFEINRNAIISSSLVDEVAAFNDSMPRLTQRERKRRVARWLRWKLTQCGMPGFKPAKRK